MKRSTCISIILILLILLLVPDASTHAASGVSIKTKLYTYKGQQYVQVVGGDKKVVEKINKTLKLHAVSAAKENTELKKLQKHYFLNSIAKTKFISNQKLSIVYEDSRYSGEVHSNEIATTYNFDLKTGKRLFLNSVAQTDQQKYNLFDGIEAKLKLNKKAYSDVFQNFPLMNRSSFYFYNEGIVIVFNPYEVGPYVAGFIEVKIPFTKINAKTDMVMFNLNKSTLDLMAEGVLPGFKGVRLGQSKAEVTQILRSSTDESYYESGGLFWILKGIDHASFNFDDEGGLDHLRDVYLSSKAFPMRTFKDVEQILGKTERYESSDYLGQTMISYRLGQVTLVFTSDTSDEDVSEILISKR
ncbi:DUF3298 and DUF4163 domain-containing protein [Paenibacillus xylanexedens]|uniref:DUF3298 and DUF4163 domain-containing protein n=1 Tax=Paenibacillus xylanexedens TaxID=528191 RepID=UPI00119E2487|nr:DUF3298 and DUF4163 domain-containing protein [Paenibacillus xylanexedens]